MEGRWEIPPPTAAGGGEAGINVAEDEFTSALIIKAASSSSRSYDVKDQNKVHSSLKSSVIYSLYHSP